MDFNLTAAIDLAKRAHKDQVRKYTGEPYITHPFAVAGLVASISDDNDMVVATILHDIIEDTPVTFNTINGIFGIRVANMVDGLSDVSVASDGNRVLRKTIDREHISYACTRTKTIKLADLIDNTKSITNSDSEFAKIYMAEKKTIA